MAGRSENTESQTLLEDAQVVNELLGGLVRSLATHEGHPVSRELPTSIEVSWNAALSEQALLNQIRESVREALAQASTIVRGRVFCYHCNDSTCQHAEPSACGEVFAGYQSTGRPRFESLLSYLLELGDERVEQVASSSPRLVARVVGRRRLLGEQLPEYGRGSLKYSIWGQVVMGYIRLGSDKHALTFQVVEGGDRRIHPQLVGSLELLDAMADGHEGRLVGLMTLLRQSSRKIENLGLEAQTKTSKGERAELREKVFKILRQLSVSFERKGRQRERRTKHAEHRRQEKRPVASGFQDLFRAPIESFFSDEVKGSLVVVGPSGRVHVYSEDGRHVTSLNLKKAEVDRRLRRKRYQPLTSERVSALRGAVQQRQSERGSEGAEDDGAIALG